MLNRTFDRGKVRGLRDQTFGSTVKVIDGATGTFKRFEEPTYNFGRTAQRKFRRGYNHKNARY